MYAYETFIDFLNPPEDIKPIIEKNLNRFLEISSLGGVERIRVGDYLFNILSILETVKRELKRVERIEDELRDFILKNPEDFYRRINELGFLIPLNVFVLKVSIEKNKYISLPSLTEQLERFSLIKNLEFISQIYSGTKLEKFIKENYILKLKAQEENTSLLYYYSVFDFFYNLAGYLESEDRIDLSRLIEEAIFYTLSYFIALDVINSSKLIRRDKIKLENYFKSFNDVALRLEGNKKELAFLNFYLAESLLENKDLSSFFDSIEEYLAKLYGFDKNISKKQQKLLSFYFPKNFFRSKEDVERALGIIKSIDNTMERFNIVDFLTNMKNGDWDTLNLLVDMYGKKLREKGYDKEIPYIIYHFFKSIPSNIFTRYIDLPLEEAVEKFLEVIPSRHDALEKMEKELIEIFNTERVEEYFLYPNIVGYYATILGLKNMIKFRKEKYYFTLPPHLKAEFISNIDVVRKHVNFGVEFYKDKVILSFSPEVKQSELFKIIDYYLNDEKKSFAIFAKDIFVSILNGELLIPSSLADIYEILNFEIEVEGNNG